MSLSEKLEHDSVPKKPKVENSKSYPPEILDMVKWFPKSPKI